MNDPFFIVTTIDGKAETIKVPRDGSTEALVNIGATIIDKTDQKIRVKDEVLVLDPVAIAIYDLHMGCKSLPMGDTGAQCVEWFYNFRPELAKKIFGEKH